MVSEVFKSLDYLSIVKDLWPLILLVVVIGILKINHDLNKEKKRKEAEDAKLKKAAKYIKEEFDKDKE